MFSSCDGELWPVTLTFKCMCVRVCQHVNITNFTTSWNDGMAFCALIHRFRPNSFDYDQLDPANRRYNFQLAFDTAEYVPGICAHIHRWRYYKFGGGNVLIAFFVCLSLWSFLWPPSRAGHYILLLWFLLLSFFFFPRLSSAIADSRFTILPHMMWPKCKFSMQVWNVLQVACWKYRMWKFAVCAPSHNFVGLYLRN